MIKEKMLEFLILEIIRSRVFNRNHMSTVIIDGCSYDLEKIHERYRNLRREFLEPYIIDSTSKED